MNDNCGVILQASNSIIGDSQIMKLVYKRLLIIGKSPQLFNIERIILAFMGAKLDLRH